jgi:hypothetical protein
MVTHQGNAIIEVYLVPRNYSARTKRATVYQVSDTYSGSKQIETRRVAVARLIGRDLWPGFQVSKTLNL